MNVMPDLDAQMRGLMDHGDISTELRINPKAIRPCVAKMLKTSFCKGDFPNRSDASAVIAAELVRIGFEQERIIHVMRTWNKNNSPQIPSSAIQSTVGTALRQRYNYSCRHHHIKEFCIGFDLCSYAKGRSNRLRYDFRAFYSYHWQLILSTKAKLIYGFALPELEKRKGLKPGSVIFENHAEIARFAGISRKYVKGGLEELAGFGLISYKVGIPRKWEGKASEIRRIFPIPKPPRKAILRVTNDSR